MTLIKGFNHILILVKDMERSVAFYQNVLGLRIHATSRGNFHALPKVNEDFEDVGHLDELGPAGLTRMYFFKTGDGDSSLLGLAELPDGQKAEASPFAPNIWAPGSFPETTMLNAVDHVAFNVESRADMLSIRQSLADHGHEVSDVFERKATPKFLKSIYFTDPDGTALEVGTWDLSDPAWAEHQDDNYFLDPDPVPSLDLDGATRSGPSMAFLGL